MSSLTRSLALLGTTGCVFALLNCSELTKVDWSAIPAAGGASGNGGTSGSAGENPGAGEAGASGEGGAAGEAGFSGEGGQEPGGFGGSIAGGGTGGGGTGGGGTNGGGTSGTAGSAGSAGSTTVVHKTCSTAPTDGVAGAANLAPTLAGAMVLFDGGAGGNGNRGGRLGSTGLDAQCEKARVALQLPQTTSHAVTSVSATDDIFHMPENYGIPRQSPHIVSPLGLEVAESWDALWKTATPRSLVCLGVMPTTSKTWLSGTGSGQSAAPGEADTNYQIWGFFDGTVDSGGTPLDNACHGWTLGTYDNDNQARVGSSVSDQDPLGSPPRFFAAQISSCDAANGNILCIAYNPTTP